MSNPTVIAEALGDPEPKRQRSNPDPFPFRVPPEMTREQLVRDYEACVHSCRKMGRALDEAIDIIDARYEALKEKLHGPGIDQDEAEEYHALYEWLEIE